LSSLSKIIINGEIMRDKETEVLDTKDVVLNGRVVEVSILKSYIYGTNKKRFTIIPRAKYKEYKLENCRCTCIDCANYKPR
jgi:hypothetical protein